MYLIYYKENNQRIWIMSEDDKLEIALKDIYNDPKTDEIRYVKITRRWEEYNGIDVIKE